MPRIAPLRILLALLVAAGPALAAPPPIAVQPDPPARVGRLAGLTGAVSFHTADQEQWATAVPNMPVTTGDAVWTEPGARASLDIGPNRLTLDAGTELTLTTLGDHALQAAQPQGSTYLHLTLVPPGDTYAVQTGRALVGIAGPGRYEVTAGDATHPTLVSVVQGAARVTAPGLTLDIAAGQTATVTGGGDGPAATPVTGALGPLLRSPFLQAMLALERPAPRRAIARLTGGADLEGQGTWATAPGVGEVWYPDVEPGWVPYRNGRWSWVAPWGWTWVDDAPWGFAPFHYGRWLQRDGRWGWTPGIAAQAEAPPAYDAPAAYALPPELVPYYPVSAEPAPLYATPAYGPVAVYAPALVSFVALGLLADRRERPVGWVPLGPNEPYYPPYRARLPYVRQLNATVVRNVTTVITDNSRHVNIYRPTIVQNFVNRGGATVVPATAMLASQPVARALLPAPPPDRLARAAGGFTAPVMPTTSTLGVTPVVAQRLRLVDDRPAPPPPAPGPAIRPPGLPGAPTPPRPLAATPGLPPGAQPPTGGAVTALVPNRPPPPGAAVPPASSPAVAPGLPGVVPTPPPGTAARPGPVPAANAPTSAPTPAAPGPGAAAPLTTTAPAITAPATAAAPGGPPGRPGQPAAPPPASPAAPPAPANQTANRPPPPVVPPLTAAPATGPVPPPAPPASAGAAAARPPGVPVQPGAPALAGAQPTRPPAPAATSPGQGPQPPAQALLRAPAEPSAFPSPPAPSRPVRPAGVPAPAAPAVPAAPAAPAGPNPPVPPAPIPRNAPPPAPVPGPAPSAPRFVPPSAPPRPEPPRPAALPPAIQPPGFRPGARVPPGATPARPHRPAPGSRTAPAGSCSAPAASTCPARAAAPTATDPRRPAAAAAASPGRASTASTTAAPRAAARAATPARTATTTPAAGTSAGTAAAPCATTRPSPATWLTPHPSDRAPGGRHLGHRRPPGPITPAPMRHRLRPGPPSSNGRRMGGKGGSGAVSCTGPTLNQLYAFARRSASHTAAVTCFVVAVPPRSGVCSAGSAVTCSTARISRAAAAASPRCSSIIAAVQNVATGFAIPLPVMSNADP